ncbi:arginine--tRNA ligase [Patescibacteria group bacterium]|nr:arginine--tRNA ligase [Patescibacteria group bacterium]
MAKKNNEKENPLSKIYKRTDSLFVQGEIRAKIKSVLSSLKIDYADPIHIEQPEDSSHGHFATNIAFSLAKSAKKSPIEIGEKLANILSEDEYFKRVDFVKPGFINFFIANYVLEDVVRTIIAEGARFGGSDIGKGTKVQVEFISANPTGPLTFPNARGGFTGDTLSSVFEKVGFDVDREYYINDSGNQVTKLGGSVYHYYKDMSGEEFPFPEDGYKGGYIEEIAHELHKESAGLSLEEVTTKALAMNIASAKETVSKMGITFNTWIHEKDLLDSGAIDTALDRLKKSGNVYEKDGAWWLASSTYNDDKDRVLIRENGAPTYVMGDIAYHSDKFEKRKFDKVINVWGADHHGDVARLKAGVHFLGIDDAKLDILLISLMKMEQEGKEVRMSKRKGVYVLMNDVLETVPLDVLRYFSLMYDVNSPVVFDLDLALDTSERNPVYYVQYAHARMSSIIRKAPEDVINSPVDLSILTDEELTIVPLLIKFHDLVHAIARNYEVHLLTHFAVELAKAFHNFYHHYRVISEDTAVSSARLELVKAIKTTLENTLTLLGVSAPEKM